MPEFSTTHALLVILVIFAVTYLLRAAPYLLLKEPAEGSRYERVLIGLRQAMPLGILLVLVVYTVRGVDWSTSAAVPAIGGIAVTAAVHLWRGHAMLTMVAGIAAYAILDYLVL